MTKSNMAAHAKGWKPPMQRADEKKAKNSPDAKGPGPNDWKKGATKRPKGC